jgi:regulator of sigma E protease
MGSVIIAVLGSLAAIVVVVIVHEWGHFVVARWVGIHVERFSIGFGRPLWSWRGRKGCEYVIAPILLGGYVKLYGQEHQSVVHAPETAYVNRPVWQRLLVVLAGPVMNVVLAVFVFTWVYSVGFWQHKPVIGVVSAHSAAASAGLQARDEWQRIGRFHTTSWQRVVMALISYMDEGQIVEVQVHRQGGVQQLALPTQGWELDDYKPNLFTAVGATPYRPPFEGRIVKVVPHSPAEKAGFLPGDRLLSIAGHNLNAWRSASVVRTLQPGQVVVMKVQRGEHIQKKKVTLASQVEDGKKAVYLGVVFAAPKWPQDMRRYVQYPWYEAWRPALSQTALLLHFNVTVIIKLLGRQLSWHTLGGPVGVFESAGKASLAGLASWLSFVAYISVMLGFINLLPIPALDGGHVLFLLIEWLRRRPLSDAVQMRCIQWGFSILIVLILMASLNYVLRIF